METPGSIPMICWTERIFSPGPEAEEVEWIDAAQAALDYWNEVADHQIEEVFFYAQGTRVCVRPDIGGLRFDTPEKIIHNWRSQYASDHFPCW